MAGPGFQRLPLLVGEVVPLIDAGDAAESAADVVQKLLDRRQLHAELAPYGSPWISEIVERPRRDWLAAIQSVIAASSEALALE